MAIMAELIPISYEFVRGKSNKKNKKTGIITKLEIEKLSNFST